MKTFNFSANAIDFGDYRGATIEAACEAFAREAGYRSWKAMTEQAIETSGAGNIEVREHLGNGQLGPDVAPDQTR